MNTKQRASMILVLLLSLVISGCAPGQIFGPTVTPTPTNTPTPTSTNTPIPPTATDTPTPTNTPTLTPLICEDSISSEISEIIESASSGKAEDPQQHLACAQLIIDKFTGLAKQQEDAKYKSKCDYIPPTNSKKAVADFNADYGALNDVGAAWMIKGLALDYLGKPDDAQAAFNTALFGYWCAYVQNPDGGYWSVRWLAHSALTPSVLPIGITPYIISTP
jgi:hypothetical protein